MLLENSAVLAVDPAAAKKALQEYREARAVATDEDRAIMTAYRAIARGKVVIQALQSIRNAGRDERGLPKLAMVRADATRCRCEIGKTTVTFSPATATWRARKQRVTVDRMPEAAPGPRGWFDDGIAIVPLVPLNLRPKYGLKNYSILWEADWKAVPHDPLLLRHLKGDLWLVLAAWDLSEVERAVLAQRSPS